MLEFLSNNWLWILLIGGMLFMHLGHGGHGGHGGGSGQAGHAGHAGCGGGHQHSSGPEDTVPEEQHTQHHNHPTGPAPER